MSNHDFRRFVLVVLLLLGTGAPVFSAVEWRGKANAFLATRPSPSAAQQAFVLADIWSLGHFFTSGGRTRIVQMCVVAMCLALFIMMKKVNG